MQLQYVHHILHRCYALLSLHLLSFSLQVRQGSDPQHAIPQTVGGTDGVGIGEVAKLMHNRNGMPQ